MEGPTPLKLRERIEKSVCPIEKTAELLDQGKDLKEIAAALGIRHNVAWNYADQVKRKRALIAERTQSSGDSTASV